VFALDYGRLMGDPIFHIVSDPIFLWAFVEASNFARRYSDEAKRFFERKKAKTNGVVATKALAHKLARASYHVLKTGQPFDVTRCFA